MAKHTARSNRIDCRDLRDDPPSGGDGPRESSASDLGRITLLTDRCTALRLIEPDGSETLVPIDGAHAKPEAAGAKAKATLAAKAKADAEVKAKAKAEAEAKKRAEAEAQAKREAEEKARAEAAKKAQEKAEQEAEQKRRDAEARAKAKAEAEAKAAAEAKAQAEAKAKAKREAEAKAREEAREAVRRKAKLEAEARAKAAAEEKARREAERKARAEAKAKAEAEAKAKRAAEAKAKKEAQAKAKREAEAKAKHEAEAKAKREAEAKAKREAEAKAKREAEERARKEAERKAKEEAAAKAKREAEAKAKREAEEKAKAEAAKKAAAEAERKAKEKAEAERKAKEQAEAERAEKEKAKAEAKAKEQAQKKAEAEAKKKALAEKKAKERAEAKAAKDAKEAEAKKLEEAADKAANLGDTFRRLIRETGPISLAHYMAESNARYYTSRDPLGEEGDFITAPEVSQMFGELIGLWFADLWVKMGARKHIHFVELGPGRGTLSQDALRAAGRYDFAPTHHMVETSPALRKIQREAFPDVIHHDDLSTLPDDAPLLIAANEFFDALPVHQLIRSANGWHERMVGLGEEDEFIFVAGDKPMDAIVPKSWKSASQGTMIETSAAASALMEEIATRLKNQGGAALIIDYGPFELRSGSTLQALKDHKKVDVFDHPGQADLTSHVDFEMLSQVAKANGADLMGVEMQGDWLRAMGIDMRLEALQMKNPADADKLKRQYDRLVNDAQMGTLFKVLGVCGRRWPDGAGFSSS